METLPRACRTHRWPPRDTKASWGTSGGSAHWSLALGPRHATHTSQELCPEPLVTGLHQAGATHPEDLTIPLYEDPASLLRQAAFLGL